MKCLYCLYFCCTHGSNIALIVEDFFKTNIEVFYIVMVQLLLVNAATRKIMNGFAIFAIILCISIVLLFSSYIHRFLYCMHAVNHALKTRLKVIHHNARLTDRFEIPDEFRDQGLVRPKVRFPS